MSANNAVATGALVLSANADPLTAKLYELEGKITSWSRRTAAKGGREGLFGGMAKMGLPSFGRLTAGLTAATGVAVGFGEALTTIRDVAKQGQIAEAMGMTAEQFTGIAGVAKSVGEDTREFVESMVTLGKMADEAAQGKGEVAPQFFKDLNLDAKEFARLRPDEMFFKFFEAAQKMGHGLKQTRAIMTAFGEDGGKWLLPLLSKTPAELRKMAAGFAVSNDKMREAVRANEALIRVTNSFRNAWRDAVIGSAPQFTAMADAIDNLAPAFSKAGRAASTFGLLLTEVLARSAAGWESLAAAEENVAKTTATVESVILWPFQKIGEGVALVIDTVELLGRTIAAVALHAGAVLIAVANGILWIPSKAGDLLGIDVAGVKEWRDELTKTFNELGDKGDKLFEDGLFKWGKRAEDVTAFFDKIREKVNPSSVKPDPELALGGLIGGVAFAPKAAPDTGTGAGPAKLAFPAAVLRNTREAYSLELRNRFGADFKPGDKAIDEAKKTNKNLEKGNKLTDRNGKELTAIRQQWEGVGVI